MARLSMSPNPSTLSNYLTDRFNIITTAEKQQGENSNYLPDIRRTLSSRGYEVDLESSVGDDEQSSIAQSISLISQMKEGKRTKVRRNTRLEDDFQWLDVGKTLALVCLLEITSFCKHIRLLPSYVLNSSVS